MDLGTEQNVLSNFVVPESHGVVRRLAEKIRRAELVDWGLARSNGGILFVSGRDGRNSARELSIDDFSQRELFAFSDRDVKSPISVGEEYLALADQLGDMQFQLTADTDALVRSLPDKRDIFPLSQDRVLLLYGPYGRPPGMAVLERRGRVWVSLGDATLEVGDYAGHLEVGGAVIVGTTQGCAALRPDTGEMVPATSIGPVESPCAGLESHDVLFIRGEGEWRQIHSATLVNTSKVTLGGSEVLYESPHDKALLRRLGESLFFLEKVEHCHVLSRLHLRTRAHVALATKGYIHDFLPIDESRVVASFSGRCSSQQSLVLFDLARQEAVDLFDANSGLSLGDVRLERNEIGDSWLFQSAPVVRGVVMQLHTAVPNEAIVRWLPELQLYTELGYTVITPNFAGSVGNGARFAAATRDERLDSLMRWVDWAKREFPGLPLILHGMSLGATLIEDLLVKRHAAVSAAVIWTPSRNYFEPVAPSCPVLYLVGFQDCLSNWAGRQEQFAALGSDGNFFYRAYRREGHVFREKSTITDALAAIAEFLDRALSRVEKAPARAVGGRGRGRGD